MNEYANQYLAQALSQEIARDANHPRRLMAYELRPRSARGGVAGGAGHDRRS